ncbi:MAG: hypothetical protein Q8Q29_01040 [Actinomycetota bacterium]|nr:hypothetical protein [Actinomycetota bacterium]
MKRNVTVFGSDTYASPGGLPTPYRHDLSLCDVLGQGKSLRVQVIGHRRSTPNARATVTFYESAKPGEARPEEWGQLITSATLITTLRPAPFDITGPFLGRVACVLEIDDIAAANPQEFALELHVTVILEE